MSEDSSGGTENSQSPGMFSVRLLGMDGVKKHQDNALLTIVLSLLSQMMGTVQRAVYSYAHRDGS